MRETQPNGSAPETLFRLFPAVYEVLETEGVRELLQINSREQVTRAVREVLAELRQEVLAQELDQGALCARLEGLHHLVASRLAQHVRPKLRRVLNATGVILQTNLGRAPLSEAAIEQICEVARGYCNLEFDLLLGQRGFRDEHAESLLLQLSTSLPPRQGQGREQAAAVVNNCAAATFLALNSLAEGGEVIVSRGELVEIGGGFRIPEILAKSGATLREVGTTNKTRISDYAAAIGPATRLILKVHRSNFRIDGFTEQPSLQQLVSLGQQTSTPVFEDQGTGCVFDLSKVGLVGESSWLHSLSSGADLVAASGDKLLGGPQCGLLVGTRAVIERLRSNPLYRALRADKLTYAALGATLLAYLGGTSADIPAIRMLQLPAEEIKTRCEQLVAGLRSSSLQAEVIPAQSVVGGGTAPGATLPSYAVALRHPHMSEAALATSLRVLDLPVLGRIHDAHLMLDLRTVAPGEDPLLLAMLLSVSIPQATSGDVLKHATP